ncbi:MAG: nucleoside deaminase [Alphaproteobacteria bacterium]|nr:nucleoside deaminase [Alphaproteobacteria bacterium]
MTPEEYMQKALNLAKISTTQDEIPVGCLIVDSATGEIITSTHNLSQHSEDATAHAEILAIRQACQILKQNRLWDMDMYVTLEPCTMCASAISFARIKNLYFGAYDEKGGAVINGVKFYEQKTCHHKPNVVGGILEEKCSQILKDFFKNKRIKD